MNSRPTSGTLASLTTPEDMPPRNRAERRARSRTIHPELRRALRPYKRAFGDDHRPRLRAWGVR